MLSAPTSRKSPEPGPHLGVVRHEEEVGLGSLEDAGHGAGHARGVLQAGADLGEVADEGVVLRRQGATSASAGPVSIRPRARSVAAARAAKLRSSTTRSAPLLWGACSTPWACVDRTRPRCWRPGPTPTTGPAPTAAAVRSPARCPAAPGGVSATAVGRGELAAAVEQRGGGGTVHDVGRGEMRLGLVHVRHPVTGVHEAQGDDDRRRATSHSTTTATTHPHESASPSSTSASRAPSGTAARTGSVRRSDASGPAAAATSGRGVVCRLTRRRSDAAPGTPATSAAGRRARRARAPSPVPVQRAADGVGHVVVAGAAHEVGALPSVMEALEPRREPLVGPRRPTRSPRRTKSFNVNVRSHAAASRSTTSRAWRRPIPSTRSESATSSGESCVLRCRERSMPCSAMTVTTSAATRTRLRAGRPRPPTPPREHRPRPPGRADRRAPPPWGTCTCWPCTRKGPAPAECIRPCRSETGARVGSVEYVRRGSSPAYWGGSSWVRASSSCSSWPTSCGAPTSPSPTASPCCASASKPQLHHRGDAAVARRPPPPARRRRRRRPLQARAISRRWAPRSPPPTTATPWG